MRLTKEIITKRIPSTIGGNLILRDQLSQHKVLLIFFAFAFEPNSVVNLCQTQARLEDLKELDYLPVGVCPENIFALNFLSLSLNITFPLVSDYQLKLSDELGLKLAGDTDYSPKVREAAAWLNRDGLVEDLRCFEAGHNMLDVDGIINTLWDERCDRCEGQ